MYRSMQSYYCVAIAQYITHLIIIIQESETPLELAQNLQNINPDIVDFLNEVHDLICM